MFQENHQPEKARPSDLKIHAVDFQGADIGADPIRIDNRVLRMSEELWREKNWEKIRKMAISPGNIGKSGGEWRFHWEKSEVHSPIVRKMVISLWKAKTSPVNSMDFSKKTWDLTVWTSGIMISKNGRLVGSRHVDFTRKIDWTNRDSSRTVMVSDYWSKLLKPWFPRSLGTISHSWLMDMYMVIIFFDPNLSPCHHH